MYIHNYSCHGNVLIDESTHMSVNYHIQTDTKGFD